MKVKELIALLEKCDKNGSILVSSDEELNHVFSDLEVCKFEGKERYCIYGLDGSEMGEEV